MSKFFKKDLIIGMLSALPISYPHAPFYWFGFLALIVTMPQFRIKIEEIRSISLLFCICSLVIIINIYNYNKEVSYCLSIIATLLTFQFYLMRYCIRDFGLFVKGFLFIIKIYTVLTFLLFLFLKPYEHGFNFFIDSELRMWASGYLVEWPNVFCCFLILGAYLTYQQKEYKWAAVHFIASLLTTSRISILGLLLFFSYYCVYKFTLKKTVMALIIISLLLCIGFFFIDNEMLSRYLYYRLFKISDRSLIYTNLWSIFQKNPLGIGNIPYGSLNEFYNSYHSSYLKILVRYGILGFILFLLLILPKKTLTRLSMQENLPILFIFCTAMFQDILLHIHLIMIYSVLLGIRADKLNKILDNEHDKKIIPSVSNAEILPIT